MERSRTEGEHQGWKGKRSEEATSEGSLLCSVHFSHLETKAPPLLPYRNSERHRLRLFLSFYGNVSPFHDFTSSGTRTRIPEKPLVQKEGLNHGPT